MSEGAFPLQPLIALGLARRIIFMVTTLRHNDFTVSVMTGRALPVLLRS